MSDKPNNPFQFWQELKRRKVFRVIAMYAATAFIIMEAGEIVLPRLGLPDWTVTFIIVLIIIGFPITVILSWIFDITPEGVKKTESIETVKEHEPLSEPVKRKLRVGDVIIAILVVVVVILAYPKIFKKGEVIELEKSIAVLPFENMSDDSEFAHLGDAITDEIIMQLYKINAFEVRSRTSIMQYKNTEKGSPLIGEELKVNYLLEGSTQRYEDQVRIRVQLIHASTDDHIWGNIFEGEWKDIFDIQINVAKQVARELKTVLSPEEVERIEDEPTENIEAYNLYLQGRYFWNQEGRDDLDKSIECYKRALEIDPNYALAYSGMAASYTSYANSGYLPRRDVMFQAKKAAMKALEIDNTLGEAHAELAHARVTHDWNWTEGEKGFKRALELNPNYASAHDRYAWLLTFVGRHDEAIQENKLAHELDPLSVGIWVRLGRRYYFARDYNKAIEEYYKVLEIFPNSGYARTHLALALSQKGLYNEAIEEYSKIEFMTSWHWYFGYIFGIAGKKEKALEILNYYLEQSKKEFVWPANIAFIYIGLGEKDKAFEWLEKTYEQREAWMEVLKAESMYDSLRSDPRFQDLVDRMNYPD